MDRRILRVRSPLPANCGAGSRACSVPGWAASALESAEQPRHLSRSGSVSEVPRYFRIRFWEVSRIRLVETSCQNFIFRGLALMRLSRFICLLPVVVLACSTAQGQSPQGVGPPKPRAQGTNAEWLKACLADWDASTHMSKSEWAITCRRLSEQPAERGESSNDFEPIYRSPRKGTRGYLPDVP
jgi:hypothetical protein